jgi:hypothetical protein
MKLGVGIVVVLLAILATWIATGGKEGTRAVAALQPPKQSRVSTLEPSPPETRAPELTPVPERAPERAPTRGVCTLRVLNAHGAPVPEAMARTLRGRVLGHADARGIIELELDGTAGTSVHVGAGGYLTRSLVLFAGQHTVTLRKDGALVLEVRWSDSNEPVAGAEVAHWHTPQPFEVIGSVRPERVGTKTDEAGRARLDGLTPEDLSERYLRIVHADAPAAIFHPHTFVPFIGKANEPFKVTLDRSMPRLQIQLHDEQGVALTQRVCWFEGPAVDGLPSATTDAAGIARFASMRELDARGGTRLLVDLGEGKRWWAMHPPVYDPVVPYEVHYKQLSGMVLNAPSTGCELASLPLRGPDERLRAGHAFTGPNGDPGVDQLELESLSTFSNALARLDWRAPEADGSFRIQSGWQSTYTAVIAREASTRALLCMTEVENPARIVLRCPPTCALTLEFENGAEQDGTLWIAADPGWTPRLGPEAHDLERPIRRTSPKSGTYVFQVARANYGVFWSTPHYNHRVGSVNAREASAMLSVTVPSTRPLSGRISGTLSGSATRRMLGATSEAGEGAYGFNESDGSFMFPALPAVPLKISVEWYYIGRIRSSTVRLGEVDATQTTFSAQVPEAAFDVPLERLGGLADHVQLRLNRQVQTSRGVRGIEELIQVRDVPEQRVFVTPGTYDATLRCCDEELGTIRTTLRDGDVHELASTRPPKGLVQFRCAKPPRQVDGLSFELISGAPDGPRLLGKRNQYQLEKERVVAAFLLDPGTYVIRVSGLLDDGDGRTAVNVQQDFELDCTLSSVTTIDLPTGN